MKINLSYVVLESKSNFVSKNRSASREIHVCRGGVRTCARTHTRVPVRAITHFTSWGGCRTRDENRKERTKFSVLYTLVCAGRLAVP